MSFGKPNAVLMSYSFVAAILSLSLLFFTLFQDFLRFSIYFGLYAAVIVLVVLLRFKSLPIVASLSFLTGFLETSWHGYNIDPGAGILVLASALYALQRSRDKDLKLELSECLLLLLAVITLISLGFTIIKITSFFPVPEYHYTNYAVNGFGVSSDDLLLQVLRTGSVLFSLFGLFLAGRSYPFLEGKELLFYSVMTVAVLTFLVLLYQTYADQTFFFPKGAPRDGRLNGPTSFCYALGAGVEILLLLTPVWLFFRKNIKLVLGVSTLLLLLYALNKSGSRTALILCSCFFAIGCIGFFIKWFARSQSPGRIIISAILGVVIISLAYGFYSLIPEETTSSLGRFKVYSKEQGGILEHLYKTRFVHYSVSIPMLKHAPLTGVGVGTYYSEASKFADLYVPGYNPWDEYGVTSNVSNFYLGLSVELGVLGGGMFLLWILLVLFSARYSKLNLIPPSLLISGFCLYAIGLLMGPQLLNSEATAWVMLYAGGIASGTSKRTRKLKTNYLWIVVLAISIVLISANILSQPDKKMFEQWKQLKWHQDNGWFPAEEGGRWTSLQSSLRIQAGKILQIKYHSGFPDFQGSQRVKFYLNEELIHAANCSGGIEQNYIHILSEEHQKGALLSIIVDKPFVPARQIDSSDNRELGIFVSELRVTGFSEGSWGFYPAETEKSDTRFFWSGRESAILYYPDKYSQILLRTLSNEYPVIVDIWANGVPVLKVKLDAQWKRVELKSKIDEIVGEKFSSSDVIVLQFRANRSFTPRELGIGNDTRNLSFAIKWETEDGEK